MEFIQAQDGLKFNNRKIRHRSDLDVALNLHQRCEGYPKIVDIPTLAFAVLADYGWMVTGSRRPLVDNILVLRESSSA